MRGTGGNRFIPVDATAAEFLDSVERGLYDLLAYAAATKREVDFGAISVETSLTNDKNLISVSVTGDLRRNQ